MFNDLFGSYYDGVKRWTSRGLVLSMPIAFLLSLVGLFVFDFKLEQVVAAFVIFLMVMFVLDFILLILGLIVAFLFGRVNNGWFFQVGLLFTLGGVCLIIAAIALPLANWLPVDSVLGGIGETLSDLIRSAYDWIIGLFD